MSPRRKKQQTVQIVSGIPRVGYASVLIFTLIAGVGAYMYFNNASAIGPQPSPSPTPTPTPTPAQLTFKTLPVIETFEWIDTSGYAANPVEGSPELQNFGILSQADMQTDIMNMKSVGMTVINFWDFPLDEGARDSNPTSYTATEFMQLCQQDGVHFMAAFAAWYGSNWNNPQFANHLQVLANYFKGYSNFAGLYFDDWGYGAGITREPTDAVGFDNFVRQNFNIGRDYFISYGFIDTINTGRLVGKRLVNLGGAMYLTAQMGDPAGIGWLQNFNAKYADPSAYPSYAIGAAFDCSGEGGSDLHNAWSAQADYAISQGMLAYMWYCWRRISDSYGAGMYARPDWWPAAAAANAKILAYIRS
jgi:hypothetical protein